MRIHQSFVVFITILVWLPAHGSGCPVTIPAMEEPDGTLKSSKYHGWYGTDDLAALIPLDGHWVGMGPDRNYFDKFWWWREGYSARNEPDPELIISGSRLDGSAPTLLVTNTTNAFGENWNAMLVGMEFPTLGCWEVIGKYHGHQLKFIVMVGG